MTRFKNLHKTIKLFLLVTAIFASKANSEMKILELPKPVIKKDYSLDDAIQKRRSVRRFDSKDLTLEQMSQLLWSAQGITDPRTAFRAAPSAGALYPLELYLVKKDGVWHYKPASHAIELVIDKDLRVDLTKAAWGQSFINEAPVNVIISAVYSKVTSRYGDRGYMYTHFEVGHAAQNLELEAVALGLATVSVGAFDEKAVASVLDLPKDQVPLYIIPVGYSK